ITVQRNGQLQTMPWLMPAISQGNQAWRLVGLLFYLPFWLVGTAVLLLLRPRDQRWRLLAAFNYVTAFWLAAGMVSQSGVANSSLVQHALSWLFVPIYLHLHLLVPTPLLRPRLRTYLLLFLYALAAALAALELFQLLPSSAYALGLLLAIPGSLGLLTWRLFDHSSPAARLAACVMLAGIGLAFGPGIILGLIPKLLDSAAPGATAMNVAMLGIPLLPLAYAYALYKRTLGPLEFRANRLLSLYSFALLYLMAFAVVFLGCQQWIPSSDGFLAFVLVVSTVSAAAAPTLYARFQRLVDRLAYGIRYDPDEIFRAFANRVPAALDRPVLVSLLADEVTPSLLIRESALVLLTNGKADLVYARGVNLAEIPETSQQVQDWLAEAGRYRPPGPEATETPTSTDWVRLAIAVKAHGPAMGVWLLGRRDPDDYYPQPDIALLTALASQVAVALENARLFEAVARGEREWQMTFDSITDWVSLVDLEARIQRTNRVGETFVGVPPAEMLGQTCCQLIHGTTEPISECPLRQMQRTRRREAAEFRIPGAERWLMITTDPLLDEHEQLVGAVHIVRDITTRKHAEEALRQHTVQLEALRQIGLELTAQLDLEALLGSVLARAVELLGATGGLVYLYDPTLKRLTAMTSLNLGRDYRGLMLDAGEGAAGQVLLTGEPLVIDDQQAWTGKSPQVAEADARSVLVVPLKWQDQVIGVLAIVDHDRAAAFDQSDQQFLVSFAIQAAIAIRNARAVAAEEYQRRQAEALVQATAALASTLELEPLLENVLAAAVQAISAAEKGSILLLDEATGILHIRAVTGYGDPRIRMIRFPQEAGYSAQAVREGRPRLIPDARAGPICYEGEIEEVRAVQSAVVAPLRYRDQVIGVISLDNVTTRGAFTADDLRLLAAFADQAAVAVENARLLDQARQRLQSLTNLSRASQIVTSSLHVDEVLQQIVTLAGSVVHSDYTSVVLVDAEGQPELGAEDFRGVPPIARRIRGTGVTRQVLDRGQPLVADTISADGMISPPFPGSDGEVLLANPAIVVAGIRSFAAVPIQVQEKRLGVLFVHSCATGAFHGQLPLLVTFANQIAVAIENARLFAAERRARQLSDILSEVVRELNAAPDLDAALALVLSYMERVIAFDSGSVLLLEGGQMNVAAVRGFAHPERVRQ
ncbi:MAG: GAF domain-containing protein, partial [Chloroflexi bacterium]|nr:GAF domain-containing protein [Chloroflexota bacterium]